jgi:hypothetical protein
MASEVPLQRGLFDEEELKDTRTRRQRKTAREADAPQQEAMFSQREVAQFGVQARPQMKAVSRSGKPLTMILQMEDPRTEEEREADQQREAESKTYSLFGGLTQADLDQAEKLVADLTELTEKLTQLVAVAAVILEQSTETLDQLGLMLAGEGATVSDGGKSKARSNGRLHPPEEIAKEDTNIFGPDFHFYRSFEFWPPARAGEL